MINNNNNIMFYNLFWLDPDKQVKNVSKVIDEEFNRSIGYSNVDLNALGCEWKECNLGNVITDAMVYHYKEQSFGQDNLKKIMIAIVNSGGIRAGIPLGSISMKQVITAIPFANTIGVCNMTGSTLWQVFEISVANYNKDHPEGRFLQVSGLKVKYDVNKPKNNRVVEISVLNQQGKYEALDKKKFYPVILPSYIANGGDGYDILKNVTFVDSGILYYESAQVYINSTSPIKTGISGRIVFS